MLAEPSTVENLMNTSDSENVELLDVYTMENRDFKTGKNMSQCAYIHIYYTYKLRFVCVFIIINYIFLYS